MKVNLRSFESFRETMSTGSVTAAAERMGMTQPAVSRLIAQLEKTIGFSLFYRDKGRLMPTPEAQILYEQVDMAFGGIDRLSSVVYDIAHYNAGQIKIVAPSGISQGVLSDILGRFFEAYPGVRASIDSRSVDTALAMVANRTADCGFAKLPIGRTDLDAEVLSVSETVCILPEGHPLTEFETISARQLTRDPLILLGFGTSSRNKIDEAFAEVSIRPRVRIETRTVGSACAYVAKGLGIAIVNELIGKGHLQPGTVMRTFRPKIPHEYAFVTSSLAPRGRLATALLEVARDYFSDIEQGQAHP